MLGQIGVGTAEVMVAEKAAVSRKWRRMRRREHQMTRTVYERSFSYGIRSPQEKDNVLSLTVKALYDSVGECFPAMALMRRGVVGVDSEGGIEQKHSL